MRRITLLAAACLFIPRLALCGADSFGEIAVVEPSVRANGMGNAYTAANGDALGMYYNPAQSADAAKAAFVFQRGYADDSTGVIALGLPKLGGVLNVGASVLYYRTGKMDLYSPRELVGNVTAESDYMGVLALSLKSGFFSIGGGAKYVKTTLFESASGSGVMCDAGLLVELPAISLGAAVQNIGGKMTLGSEAESFKTTQRAGAYRHFTLNATELNGAFDLVRREGEPAYARAGAELVLGKTLALRGGYEFKNSAKASGTAQFGIGLKSGVFALDYAISPNSDLGSTHKFGLSINFH